MIHVTSLQLGMADTAKSRRIQTVLGLVDQAPESDLIVLPEIWPTGFFCFDRYTAESESLDGELVAAFREKAVERKCFLHMGSFVEKDGDRFYNTSLLFNPGGDIIARYCKVHLFGYQSMEQQLLTPGTDVVTVRTPFAHIGLATCYDLRFPELFRKMSEKGVDLIVVTSAWPLARLSAWVLFNRARALENLSFLVSCNCAGANAGTAYAGNSMVVSPLGEVLEKRDETPGVVSRAISMDAVVELRREFPALADRVF